MALFRSMLMASFGSALCFVSGFLTLFTPLPLMSLALVRGLRFSVVAATLAFVLVTAFEVALNNWQLGVIFQNTAAPQSFRLVYYVALAMLALLASYGIRRGRYVFFAALAVSLASFMFLAWALVVQVASHGTFYTQWQNELSVLFQTIAREQTQGASLGLEAERLASLAPQFAAWVTNLFPALFYVYMALVLSFNVGLARRMPKLHRILAPVRGIAQFRNPENLIWAVLGMGFVFLGNEHSFHLSWLKLLSLNVLLGLLALYAAQGFGVWTSMLYFLRVRRFFRQVLFLALVFSFQFALPLLVGVGLVDVWWDWRSKMRHALKK